MTNSNILKEKKMTEPRTDLRCTVCRKHRARLHPRKSKLLPGMPMFLCSECFEAKKEPRFAVLLVARDPDQGLAAVRDYIRHHRYDGDKITLDELC
jgi:hypothetical protein